MIAPHRIRRTQWVALLTFAALLAAAGIGSFAAFSSTTQNASSLASAPDWTPPAVSSETLAATTGATPGHVKPGDTYNVYANISDSGNPAAGVAGATADAAGISTGQGAAALTSGSYTLSGTSYNWRTANLTADATIPACRYAYPITATDSASPANSATQTGQQAMVDRDLAGDYNVRIDGESTGGRAGYSVSGAGDVNGDGRPDALVGAIDVGHDARTTAGSVYVVFGQSSPTNLNLAALGTQGYRIDGLASGYQSGYSVANAGDVNGDGKPDQLIGAQGGSDAYVIFGKATTTNIDLNAIGTQGYRIDGVSSTGFGISVANAGDVNGDTKPDAIVGAYVADNNTRTDSGSAYVIFGKSSTTAVDVTALGTQGYRIDGAAGGDNFGRAVGTAGDLNADGKADLVVGADLADNNTRTDSGSAWVIFGKATTTTIDVASLGTQGYRIDGATSNDNTGWRVGNAGDVNGDGKPDTLLGAYQADANTRTDSGSVFIVFGKSTTTAIDLNALGTGGYRIDGAVANDQAGWGAANAGDVNADGKNDLLIGALYTDGTNKEAVGAGYVVYGKATTTNQDLNALGTGGYRMIGEGTSTQLGWSLSGAGDVNGDGRQDAVIGAYGRDRDASVDIGAAYVIFGQATPTNVDLANLGTAGYRIDGAVSGDQTGYSVADAGDLNADGKDDTLVGAPNADFNSRVASGSVYVVFGKSTTTAVDLNALGTGGYRIDGSVAGGNVGVSVDNAGDLNGDGIKDQLIGAHLRDNNSRTDSGSVYVVFGKATTTNIDLNGFTGGYRIDGATAGERAGRRVANAGDVNGDGKPDALIGADLADNNTRTDSGSVYVVFGKSTTTTIDLNALGTGGYRIDGAAAGDILRSVTGAGDVNADGKADTLLGAYAADANGRATSGAAYMIFGKATTTNIDLNAIGTQGYRIDGAAAGDNTGYSVANVGDVNGDATPDALIGAYGFNKVTTTDSGAAYVVFGKSSTTNIDLIAPGTDAYRIDGAATNDQAGITVASAGDVNGTGRSSFLVAARYADPSGDLEAGSVYMRYSPPCSYSKNVLATPGLLGYWRLGESSGTSAADSKGTNTGTYTNGPTLGVGDALDTDDDDAVTVDGSNDNVALGAQATTTDFTIEGWTYLTDATTNNNTLYGRTGTVRLMPRPAGVYAGVTLGGTEYALQPTTASNINTWVHWAFVRSGATLRIYRNGTEVTNRTDLPSATTVAPSGDIGMQSASNYLKGKADEVAYYNTALSAVRVQDHYDAR